MMTGGDSNFGELKELKEVMKIGVAERLKFYMRCLL